MIPLAVGCLRRAILLCIPLVAINNLPARAADALQAAPSVAVVQRGAISGKRQQIGFFYELNPDCSTEGVPVVHVLLPPIRGKLETTPGEGFSNFVPGNQRYACNMHKSTGLTVFYTSDRGVQGNDQVILSVVYPHGAREVMRFVITVEPDDSVHMSREGWRRV